MWMDGIEKNMIVNLTQEMALTIAKWNKNVLALFHLKLGLRLYCCDCSSGI